MSVESVSSHLTPLLIAGAIASLLVIALLYALIVGVLARRRSSHKNDPAVLEGVRDGFLNYHNVQGYRKRSHLALIPLSRNMVPHATGTHDSWVLHTNTAHIPRKTTPPHGIRVHCFLRNASAHTHHSPGLEHRGTLSAMDGQPCASTSKN